MPTSNATAESQALPTYQSEHKAQFIARSSLPFMATPALNLPEAQRSVVKRIVNNEDNSAILHLSSQRHQAFSGRRPRPQNETVELMLNDLSFSDLQRSRKIFESLLLPAADMERYATFMNTFQDVGEKPSLYLQQLQVALNLAVKKGGVPHTETYKHLLNQSYGDVGTKPWSPNSNSSNVIFRWTTTTEEEQEAAKTLWMK